MNYQWFFDDQRLQYIGEEWDNFIQQIKRNDSIVVIYHADLDGALGGAYALNALKNVIGPRDIQTYWVSTDEYHFVDLRNWISKENPHFAIFLDVAVENHHETLKFLEKNISKGCFIYDHHIIHDSSDFNEKIVVANPTPKKLGSSEKPIPTFLFAHYLAKIYNLPFPDWLALLAIFEEGVDTFFKDEVSDLLLRLYNIRVNNNFRKVFFEETKLGQIGPYLSASFTRGNRRKKLIDIIEQIVLRNIKTEEEFICKIRNEYRADADEISVAISNYVDLCTKKIMDDFSDKKIIIIPFTGPRAALGPVASILRGIFPDCQGP